MLQGRAHCLGVYAFDCRANGCVELQTSPSGAGTRAEHDYTIDANKLVLTDSVGSVRNNLASGKVLAADLVLMFLSATCRAEEIPREVLALAYRLRRSMKVAFILPKMDSWIQGLWKEPGQIPDGEVVLARAHNTIANDLVTKLETSVEESVTSCDIEIAPDLLDYMDLQRCLKKAQLKRFSALRCFFSQKNYDIENECFPYLMLLVMENAMARERKALLDLICDNECCEH
eukprot:SM000348S12863  [mRNA]  locus=s348:44540:45515:+ [translate_table: standard]